MNILHRLIYGYCAQVILPYTRKFYGTLPQRIDFYRDVYRIPADKLSLLEMGADDKYIDFSRKNAIRQTIRKKYNIDETAVTLISGGKIEPGKNILSLIEAFKLLKADPNIDRDLNLIIFGTPIDELREQFESSTKADGFVIAGWINPEDVYDLYFSADMAVFPGTHSVLWEQAIGCGLPCVFKRWDGIEHVDIGGNCVLLDECDTNSLKNCLTHLLTDTDSYKQLKYKAEKLGPGHFSYKEIAKKAIEYADV